MENGNVPKEKLVLVEPRVYLESETAKAYLKMKKDAAVYGIKLDIPAPAGGYRSREMQQSMHDNPIAWNLDPNSSIPLAPVGSSTHGFGTRVDIVVGKAREWVIANHKRYGFIREFGKADPGHFKFLHPTYASVIEPIIIDKETLMKNRFRQVHYVNKSGDFVRMLYSFDNGLAHIWNEGKAATFANRYAKDYETQSSIEVTESMFNEIKRACNAINGK